MRGAFRIAREVGTDLHDWGSSVWISHPPSTGAQKFTIIEGTFKPGGSHSFHKHPDQEEVVYIVAGEVEQWIEDQKRLLGPGDAAFIPAGIVHASFNAGKTDAKLIAIFGPSVGVNGFETVEMADETPWSNLRV